MKKLITLFLTFFSFTLFAQTITVTASGCHTNRAFPVTGSNTINSVTRNIYVAGGNDRIIYTSTSGGRWEIQYTSNGFITFSSDFYNVSTTAKPPALTVGTWVNNSVGGSCGNLTVFSGDVATTLPIELISFDANTEGSKNHLTWSTASETNNKGFDIERSRDGNTFQSIGNVKGIGKAANYNFVDANPFGGINYYRLKQVDFDGTETLSKVVSVTTTGKGTSKIKIFPSHTEGSLSIESGALAIDNIQVFNNVGQLVLSSGSTSRLDLSAMPSGLYLVQVKAGSEVATEKVFKN